MEFFPPVSPSSNEPKGPYCYTAVRSVFAEHGFRITHLLGENPFKGPNWLWELQKAHKQLHLVLRLPSLAPSGMPYLMCYSPPVEPLLQASSPPH